MDRIEIIKCQGSGQHQDELNNSSVIALKIHIPMSASVLRQVPSFTSNWLQQFPVSHPHPTVPPAMPKADVRLTPKQREFTRKGHGQVSRSQMKVSATCFK